MRPPLGLLQPQLDPILGHPVAMAVHDLDPALSVVFNRRNGRYEVYDKAAPGGPKWQLVMRVQEPDGAYRPLDGRVLTTLREARGRRVDVLLDEMDVRAEQREAAVKQWISDTAAGFADDLKYVGRHVVPSVAWRDRTDPAARERIRREGGLS